jgi:hypothetical protein
VDIASWSAFLRTGVREGEVRSPEESPKILPATVQRGCRDCRWGRDARTLHERREAAKFATTTYEITAQR